MIRKIKWNNHDILGNLEIDLTKDDGTIYPNVVIAGENGSGKTTILETLATFLNLSSMKPFDYIEYDVNVQSFRIFYKTDDEGNSGFHYRKDLISGEEERIHRNSSNSRDVLEKDAKDIRSYGVLYSKARSGFKTNQVKGSSTQQIDNNKYFVDESDDYTTAKQLIVDLRAQDNEKLMKLMESGERPDINEFKRTHSKLYRFTKAFDNFFDGLCFKEVNEESINEKQVLFEKFGKTISIDNLSTGEKQIVFRGTQLLRNSNAIHNGIVLIDEPELSMHPRWQAKILDFYVNLFDDSGDQLIITTHSEYVLRSALQRPNDTLVIILNNKNGSVKQKKVTAPRVLANITFAETNNIAFDIYSNDYHTELYGYLQHKEGLETVKESDDFILNSSAYDASKHSKPSRYHNPRSGKTITYSTLPTFIRNAIDHPDNGNVYSDDELKVSTELLIQLCGSGVTP